MDHGIGQCPFGLTQVGGRSRQAADRSRKRLICTVQRRPSADATFQHGCCPDLRLTRLSLGRAGRFHSGLRDVPGLFLLQGVSPGQWLALVHRIALLHENLDDLAAKAETDLDIIRGMNGSGQRGVEGQRRQLDPNEFDRQGRLGKGRICLPEQDRSYGCQASHGCLIRVLWM